MNSIFEWGLRAQAEFIASLRKLCQEIAPGWYRELRARRNPSPETGRLQGQELREENCAFSCMARLVKARLLS